MASVNYRLAQSESKIHYPVIFLFAAYRIIVDRSCHTGQHRVIVSVMLRAADALDYNTHLFLAEQISCSLYICPASAEVY